ncbi:MAG: ABC transporter [Gracilibacter sp. BRH_c7a]|nr:MAG: ABC transporter [Gracilibacter sp. BRH_c7a]
MSVVSCENLSKAYNNFSAVKNLSFDLGENKITGLIGRNGAGKTTLLKLIAGFLRPTSGAVKVFSQNPFDNITVSSNIIFIDDNMNFPVSLTLSEILDSAGMFYKNWDDKFARKLISYFSLDLSQSHFGLSKGMKSTFNVIIGIATRCPLTLFDEPTTGMDSAVRKDFYRALLKDYVEHPRTFILSSHLLNEIDDILEDVLLIKDGTKALHLPVLDLKEYAIGLRGSQDVLKDFSSKDIIHEESFGSDSSYIVVKNQFSQTKLEQLKASGVSMTSVASDDLCNYLTAKTKGGIDDVFNRE